MKSRGEVSAGGLVYRRRAEQIEVLICKDAGYHRWVLPKGLVRRGESLEQAALRETAEETGVQGRIVAALGEPERYIYTARGVRVFKEVHYFLMEYQSGSETEHDAEMEDVRWAPVEEAHALLAYPQANAILQRAEALLAGASAGQPAPPDTPPPA